MLGHSILLAICLLPSKILCTIGTQVRPGYRAEISGMLNNLHQVRPHQKHCTREGKLRENKINVYLFILYEFVNKTKDGGCPYDEAGWGPWPYISKCTLIF